jgi:hypothetical protein
VRLSRLRHCVEADAQELADFIASLLRDEVADAVIDDAEPDGPLFAKLRLRGTQGHFVIVVEQLPRSKTTPAA